MIEEQLDEASGKYQTFISAMVAMQSNNTNGRYKLGLRFYGKQGDEMNMWTDSNSGLTDNGSDEFVAGTPDGSTWQPATMLSRWVHTSQSGNGELLTAAAMNLMLIIAMTQKNLTLWQVSQAMATT